MILIASLNGTDLPVQFSYKPYVPSKRNSVIPTAGAVIVQSPVNQIIHGEEGVEWEIEAATPPEFQTLHDLYDTALPTLYPFIGYWGEEYEVYFTNFDKPPVSGRLYDLSGLFQVISVTTPIAAACSS